MSFNLRVNLASDGLNAWPYRRDFVVSIIKDYAPDLLGVQEGLPDMIGYLKDNLNVEYDYWGRGRAADGSSEASGLFFKRQVWSKVDGGFFWLSHTPQTPGSQLPNTLYPRMVI